ncbi:DUF3365 domain-containing protein [Aurantibacter crassamenti]|uniref:Tll0287-like domain-containing protein n=1 Tax=Aurantibacter crassamenti TaxID=1837375 RepID=UPI0019399B01|nr:DUF3365 domain-containing protein [Aurantibacter crassamenti]MBM1106602.1 DUF3365 domain-containing protein [Aurantibacter crassamenti]
MKNLILVAVLLIFAGCKDAKQSESKPIEDSTTVETGLASQQHLGKKIIETECYMCHNPKASESSMIAPPMIAIKKFYKNSSTTKEEFTDAIMLWIDDPEAPSKMPMAQEKFGKMPYLPYSEETVKLIAEYMYDYEIEKPKWFDAHYAKEHGNGAEELDYKEIENSEIDNTDIGLGYAQATKAILGKNLMKAINENGTVTAIEFCNTKAMKLTDSMSVMKNAIIKRVSDKPRNPQNMANNEELGYINYFKKAVASGIEIKPIVQSVDDEINFYYPITTNSMCLQCHGNPNEQVEFETLETLKNLYPSDKALGYNVNEVRGIWAINFDEDNSK